MAWIYLVIAGIFEVAWVIGLKYTEGFAKVVPTVLTLVGNVASVFFLALAVQKIPLSSGYAIWTGIGAVGTVIFSILFFAESAAPSRLFFIAMIVVGIIGLKVTSGH